MSTAPRIEVRSDGTAALLGSWTLSMAQDLSILERNFPSVSSFDASTIEALDTRGALAIVRLRSAAAEGIVKGLSQQQIALINLVDPCASQIGAPTTDTPRGFVAGLGKSSLQILGHVSGLMNSLGRTLFGVLDLIRSPRRLRTREFFVQLELTCVHAIPIIALLTFLVGTVIAYLFASQIIKYGANIFVVDGIALAMCRELSPLIIAVVVAGRSGSAFTAQIGTMKLNEEIDAMVTFGLSPQQVLIIPRVLALIIAMPLLTFIGDLIGIAGGMLVSEWYLGITPTTFIERLQNVLKLKSYFVGIGKAPVFALFIALIGCRMGLCAENNARSIGINTTSTVVQSIAAVIIINAFFAVVFVELGI